MLRYMILCLGLFACRTDPTSQPKTKNHDFDGDGYTEDDGDCNDEDIFISPDADETCDEIDNNCNGAIDEDVNIALFIDSDGDGYGSEESVEYSCTVLDGFVLEGGDCNDADETINPGVSETCDEIDNNCNGDVDEAVGEVFYPDNDGDGFGGIGSTETLLCELQEGYSESNDDCNDSDPTISPSSEEYCDDVDNNCDGEIDEDTAMDVSNWYLDSDVDGYGVDDESVIGCMGPPGYSPSAGDCNDGDASINPDSTEICDGIDNDCDDLLDDEDTNVGGAADWFLDFDQDGFGTINTTVYSCDMPSGYVLDATDCDDQDSSINPDAIEVCDGIDNNCNNAIDEVGCK
jgi:hypothetical protein